MTIRMLKSMFDPGSIAIISRDRHDGAPAVLVERNLLEGGSKDRCCRSTPIVTPSPGCSRTEM